MDLDTLRRLAAEDPGEFLYRFTLAQRLADLDDPPWDEVATHVDAALAMQPDHLVSIQIKVRLLADAGEKEAARTLARHGLDVARRTRDSTAIYGMSDLIDDLGLD